jgi:NAD dependent epimerase/dehydratase family enzyme
VSLANLMSAIRFVLREAACAGETYVVADPSPLTIGEIVTALRRGRGRRPGLAAIPEALLRLVLTAVGRGINWEQISGGLVADPAKLMAAGWRPERDTMKALAEMV